MRLSIEDMHGPDPVKRELCWNADVYLNGRIISHCIEADEERGFIRRYYRVNGEYQLSSTGNIVVEQFAGKVEIRDRRRFKVELPNV